MGKVVISFKIEKKTREILDYLSYITRKSKSQLIREAILLLVEKYKEKGYNIPDKIIKRSDIVMQDIEKISDISEPENNNENINDIEKLLIINIKEILISLFLSKSSKKIDLIDNRINKILSKINEVEALNWVKRILEISNALNKFIKERMQIIKEIKGVSNLYLSESFDKELASFIDFVKENKDLEKLLNALSSGLDNFEKELKEIESIYDKIKEVIEV